MNKKNASIFLAIVLDLIFASIFLFYFIQNPQEQVTLHMNQVGIYENEENAQQMIQQLHEWGINAFFYTKEDLFIVVTTPTSEKQECLKEQKELDKHNISYLLKEVTSSSLSFVEAVKQKDIKNVGGDESSKVAEMSEQDRPREKALNYGIQVLTNKELLAILLRSGIHGKSVLELAEEILSLRNHLGELSQISINELVQIKGIKAAKALELLACFELSRRISYQQIEDKDVMDLPKALVRWLNKQIGYFDQEHFFVLFLNTKNCILSYKSMFVGSCSSCHVSAKEIFTEAMRISAQRLIIAHNHPSGNIEPSRNDIALTQAIVEVGNLCGIPLLDHIIVGKNNYYSFKENQRMD